MTASESGTRAGHANYVLVIGQIFADRSNVSVGKIASLNKVAGRIGRGHSLEGIKQM